MQESKKPQKPRRGIAERRKNNFKHQKRLEHYLNNIWPRTSLNKPNNIVELARKDRDHYTEYPRDEWDDRHGDPTYYYLHCEDKNNYLGNAMKEYNTTRTLSDEEPEGEA